MTFFQRWRRRVLNNKVITDLSNFPIEIVNTATKKLLFIEKPEDIPQGTPYQVVCIRARKEEFKQHTIFFKFGKNAERGIWV